MTGRSILEIENTGFYYAWFQAPVKAVLSHVSFKAALQFDKGVMCYQAYVICINVGIHFFIAVSYHVGDNWLQ